MTINFACSEQDQALILQIVKRGLKMVKRLQAADRQIDLVFSNPRQCMMDIQACHCNGTPLKLLQLLMSSEADFAQDFAQICLNINRSDGKLYNYTPIFAENRKLN